MPPATTDQTSTARQIASMRKRRPDVVPFWIADAEQEIECTCMTTQQKITAIQAIVKNHLDNVAAMRATNAVQGLEALVIEAMNTALKDDLAVIFAANSSRPAAQNVRQKRRT